MREGRVIWAKTHRQPYIHSNQYLRLIKITIKKKTTMIMEISKTRKAYCIVYQGSNRCTPSHVFLTNELRMTATTTATTTIGPTLEKLTQPSHKARLSLCIRRTNVPWLHKLISTQKIKTNKPTTTSNH